MPVDPLHMANTLIANYDKFGRQVTDLDYERLQALTVLTNRKHKEMFQFPFTTDPEVPGVGFVRIKKWERVAPSQIRRCPDIDDVVRLYSWDSSPQFMAALALVLAETRFSRTVDF